VVPLDDQLARGGVRSTQDCKVASLLDIRAGAAAASMSTGLQGRTRTTKNHDQPQPVWCRQLWP